MTEVVQRVWQEWVNPINLGIDIRNYAKKKTTGGTMVLCHVERYYITPTESEKLDPSHIQEYKTRYVPLRFEDLEKPTLG